MSPGQERIFGNILLKEDHLVKEILNIKSGVHLVRAQILELVEHWRKENAGPNWKDFIKCLEKDQSFNSFRTKLLKNGLPSLHLGMII